MGRNEGGFDFLQDHSMRYLEMALRTDRCERPENADGYGKKKGECGDTVEMFISIKDARIIAISFMTDGCMSTNACANTVAQLAEGRGMEEAWEITPEDLSGYLETLPRENFHCAELAVGTFYMALADAGRKSNP